MSCVFRLGSSCNNFISLGGHVLYQEIQHSCIGFYEAYPGRMINYNDTCMVSPVWFWSLIGELCCLWVFGGVCVCAQRASLLFQREFYSWDRLILWEDIITQPLIPMDCSCCVPKGFECLLVLKALCFIFLCRRYCFFLLLPPPRVI